MIEFSKKIFNTKPNGVRRVGRPKLRWDDGADQDIRMLRGQELEKGRPRHGRMGKASEKGQSPSEAVKPMMMIKLISISIFYNLTRTFYWIGFFCLRASTIKVIQALKSKMSIQMP